MIIHPDHQLILAGEIMKKRFSFIMMLLIVIIGCTSHNNPQQQINYKAYVKNRLNLTDKQENSYWLIMARYESEKHTIIEKCQYPHDVTTCQNELTALSNETIKSLEILLTEKQLSEWRKFIVEPMMQEMAEPTQKMDERRPPPNGGPPPGDGRRGW